MSAQGRAQRRWGLGDHLPERDPELVASIWLDEGQYACAYVEFHSTPDGVPLLTTAQRAEALWICAWCHAFGTVGETPQPPQPAIWYRLSEDGGQHLRTANAFVRGRDWRNALWLLRRWFWLTRQLWKTAWQMARGVE